MTGRMKSITLVGILLYNQGKRNSVLNQGKSHKDQQNMIAHYTLFVSTIQTKNRDFEHSADEQRSHHLVWIHDLSPIRTY